MKTLNEQITEYINGFKTLPDGTLNPKWKSGYSDYYNWNWSNDYDGKLIATLKEIEEKSSLEISFFNRNQKIRFRNPEKLNRHEVFEIVMSICGNNWHTLKFTRNGQIWLWLQPVEPFRFGY